MSNRQADIEQELNSLWVHSGFGDNLCYRQLLSELALVLRKFLEHLMPDHSNEVEDVLQISLLAVHLKRHTYTGTGWITNWLYDICVFKCLQYQHQRGRTTTTVTAFDHWSDIVLNQALQPTHASQFTIEKIFCNLSAKQRLALEQTRLGDTSVVVSTSSQNKHGFNLHAALKVLYNHWSR